MERLEERALLAFNFASLAAGITSEASQAETVIASRVQEASTPLPIIGQSIRGVVGDAAQQIAGKNGFLGALKESAQSLTQTNPQTNEAIRDVVFSKLSKVLLDSNLNGQVERNDVVVISNAATGNLTITVGLTQQLRTSSQELDFALGLPGIPFQVNGRARVGVTSRATLDRLTFGLQNNLFFVNSTSGSTFQIDVAATLDTTFTGTFGFFRAEVSPRVPDGVRLGVQLRMDANGLQLSNPRLGGNAVADLQFATVLPNAGLLGGRLGLPNFQFNLYMNWPLNGAYNAGQLGSLGASPTVELRNVRFGLGTYLSEVIKPVTDNLFRAFEPILPVFDALGDPIPGLSDLTESAGLGETSIESAIKLVTPFLSPDLQLASNVLTTLVDVGQALNAINSDPGGKEIFIDVGDLNLSNTNGDLRGLASVNFDSLVSSSFTKLSQLVVPLQTGLRSVRGRIEDIPGPLGVLVRQQFQRLDREILKLENGAGYELPVIDNPTILFRLLLGEDVELITFKAIFHSDASVTRVIPFWGPIGARLNGTIGFDGYLRAGYDTYGLRQFLHNGARNVALLGNGLYFDSSRELIRLNGSISGGAAVSVPIGFVPIGFVPVQLFATGSINGSLRLRGENGSDQLTIRLVDNKLDNGANKVRVFEDGELNGKLFALQGELVTDLNFAVDVGPLIGPSVTVLETGVTSPHVLLTTADIDNSDPFENLSSVPTAIPANLVVDMLFFDEGNDGIDDTITVQRRLNDSGVPFIEVYVNGDRRAVEPESLVLNVIINGSSDNDQVIAYDVTRPILLDGRGGPLNTLTFDDRARVGERRTLEYTIGDSFIHVGRGNQIYSTVSYANLTSLFVFLNEKGLTNKVSIPSVSGPITIQGGVAGDRIEVGGATHSLYWMKGFLRIFGGGGFDTIEFNDTSNIAAADVTLGWYLDEAERLASGGTTLVSRRGLEWTSVANIPGSLGQSVRAATPVTRRMIFKEVENVSYRGGPNGNRVRIQDSYSLISPVNERIPTNYSIIAGAGNDEALVWSNTGQVTIEGSGGDDIVAIGDPVAGTDALLGDQIRFSNATGTVTLAVDNSASERPRHVSLRMNGDTGYVEGFGPTVRFDARELVGLEIRTGRASDRIDVYDTPRNAFLRPLRILTTKVITGEGWDEVYVHKTTGPLIVDSESSSDFTSLSSGRGLDSYSGSITVNGGRLLIDDSRSRTSRTFTLTENSLIDPRLPTLQFTNLSALFFDGNSQGNRFSVDGTPRLSGLEPAVISTGHGNDYVQVRALNHPLRIDLSSGVSDGVIFGGPGLSLDGLQSSVALTGNATNGFVEINDSGESESRQISIHQREIAIDGVSRIRMYYGFQTFTPRDFRYLGGSGDDQIYVYGDPNSGDTNLNPGPGDDYVFFGSLDGRLSNLGVFSVLDNQGVDSLFLEDSAEVGAQNYILDRAIFQRVSTTGTQVTFSDDVDLVAVRGGAGENQWNIDSIPTATFVEFIGGVGNERLIGPDVNAQWQIVDPLGRHAITTPTDPEHGVAFSEIEGLRGGSADDTFIFEMDALKIAGSIDGGGGSNTLDYSQFPDDVYVNLATRQADLVAGSVSGIQQVIGGNGNDVLVGIGNNRLLGMAGHDLLVAGASASYLSGGDGEDILIGGTTAYDHDRAQLESISDFWADTSLDYASRIDRLLTGSGVPSLGAGSVRGNGVGNRLFGERDLDFFFAALGSVDDDRDSTEAIEFLTI